MKRILISITAIAVLIAGCGSGGSTTPVAHKSTTTTSSTTSTTHTTHKKKPVVRKHRTHKPKPAPSSGGGAVTTTTTATPPPPTTTTATPPPASTTTSAPPPVTTHQAPPPKKHHHHGGCGSHGCGYCLSVTDRIDTPNGSVPVAQITPGMEVWSTNQQGRRIAVKVLEVHHTPVPATHLMVSLHLADGRAVLASLGHPLPDGAAISTLAVGQQFEGSTVTSDARVVYGKPYTYDLLPAGPTHTYFSDGVLLGSTLAPVSLSHLF